MALRRYAGAKDVDYESLDVYETPELTEDRATTQSSRSPSPDSGSDDGRSGAVDRRHLDANTARSRFQTSRVDATGADFSERIHSHKRSYRTSRRRARSGAGEEEEYGDFSDEEESKEHRLARLRREIAELSEEFETAEDTNGTKSSPEESGSHVLDEIQKLSAQLDTLYNTRHSSSTNGAEADLQTSISRFSQLSITSPPSNPPQPTPSKTTTLAPQQQEYLLTRASDFDARLSTLESTLGLTSLTMPELTTSTHPPVLSSLDTLSKQIAAITSTTPATLDASRRKIQQLTADAEALFQARTQARNAAAALAETGARGTPRQYRAGTLTGGGGSGDPMTPDRRSGSPTKITGGAIGAGSAAYIEDPERVAKINALYGTLEKIEGLAPTLPLILERLRTLRLVHAAAGTASGTLDEMEKRQARQAEEIREWREALEGVEGKMREGEGVLKGNVELVGGWVRELEGRVKRLG